MKSNQTVFILGFHLFFVVVLLLWSMHAPIGDWGNYYYGARGYVDGNSHLIHDPTQFNLYVDSWHTSEHFFLSYTQVPPLSLLIYFPFTLMKIGLAKLVFIVFSYLICVFSITRLFRKLQIDFRWSMLLPLLFLLPMKSNIDSGQSYFLLIAIFAEGWMARENGKWILSACLFALAIHLKIFPAIVLIWLLAEKDRKLFGATICAVGIFFAISLPFVDWGIWKYYSVEVLPRLAKGEITNTYSTSYQSMQVFLKQLFVPDALHNKGNAFDLPVIFSIGNFIWSGIVLITAGLFSLNKKYSSFFRFSIWIFAGMLVSGYGSSYGLLQFIFIAIAIISIAEISIRKRVILLILIAIVSNIPVQWFLQMHIPFSFPRLFFILIFIGTIIYYFRPQWNTWALLVLIIPLVSMIDFNDKEEGSRYFLNEESSLLITDFRIDGDTIKYVYRDVDGLHDGKKLFPEHIEQAQENSGNSHFVFFQEADYNFPGEQISKLFIINNNYFLYLSDRNRGVGFNTLRIKEIDPKEHEKRVKEFFQK